MPNSPNNAPEIISIPDDGVICGLGSIALINGIDRRVHYLAQTSNLPGSNIIEGQLVIPDLADNAGRKFVEPE